jgi:hypothetical protein
VFGFLRNMSRLGTFSDDVRTQLDAEGALVLAEQVGVVSKFSGSVPGRFDSSSTSRWTGAFAISPVRVLAVLAVRSDPSAIAADCRWDAGETGPMKIIVSATGVTLDVDVHRVDARFHGQLTLHYKHALPSDVLDRLPNRALRQDVSATFVCQALGVRPPKDLR